MTEQYDVLKACEWRGWVAQPGDTLDPAAANLPPKVVEVLVAQEAIRPKAKPEVTK